jgi:hypothetical protein
VMRALVVYESMSGNTRDIAWAIADGLRSALPVDVVDVGMAPAVPDDDVDLLIVGAPTHLFGLSRPRTRMAAARRAGLPVVMADAGLREWLDGLPRSQHQRDALSFETRLRVDGFPGSAARGAAKRLRRRGYRMLWPSRSFIITKPSGSLVEREIERAQLWGHWIGGGIEVKQSRL